MQLFLFFHHAFSKNTKRHLKQLPFSGKMVGCVGCIELYAAAVFCIFQLCGILKAVECDRSENGVRTSRLVYCFLYFHL